MMGSASSGVAIYGPERAQNTKDMAKFPELICFDHNFLSNAVIKLIFPQVTYPFSRHPYIPPPPHLKYKSKC